ncbi:hypothetical protein DX910_02275 [Acinetobacter haemolyticus]|nr:hypothetical protein DX910_02275 [Acinetobacter haemolyticus]
MADGAITVDIDDAGTGLISGGTTDVAPGSDVVLTITGQDANGDPVSITRTVQTDANGDYSYQLVVGDGIADGSSVDVEAVALPVPCKPMPMATTAINWWWVMALQTAHQSMLKR